MNKYAFISYDDAAPKISIKIYDNYYEAYFNMKTSFDEASSVITNHFIKYVMKPGDDIYEEYKDFVTVTSGLTYMHLNIQGESDIHFEIAEISLDDNQEIYDISPMYMILNSNDISWGTDLRLYKSDNNKYTKMRDYFLYELKEKLRNDYDPEKHCFKVYNDRIKVEETADTMHMYILGNDEVFHYE
jgi:hypothetical protein